MSECIVSGLSNTSYASSGKILNVEHLYQNNNQSWSNIKISDGKNTSAWTYGQMGCQITSYTMIWNYINETNYTPDEFARKYLRFSKDGVNAILDSQTWIGATHYGGITDYNYWLSYSPNTNYGAAKWFKINEWKSNSTALAGIKASIDQGVPVCIYGINNGLMPHFIVCYGYNNSCTSFSDVLVHDPYYKVAEGRDLSYNLQEFVSMRGYNLYGYLTLEYSTSGNIKTSYDDNSKNISIKVSDITSKIKTKETSKIISVNYISSLRVAVWTNQNGQDDIKWINLKKQSDGSYICNDSIVNHNNEIGFYNIHVYMRDIYGRDYFVGSSKLGVLIETTPIPEGAVTSEITNITSEGYTVKISGIPSTLTKVTVPTWTDKNSQDDLKWYDAEKQEDGTYTVNVKVCDHQYMSGKYYSHVYVTNEAEEMICVSTCDISVPSAEASITVQNFTGGFKVTLSKMAIDEGITSIKVPIWTASDGQDDLKWYDAEKKDDGTYQTIVYLTNHYSQSGEYYIHTYANTVDGNFKFIGATSHIVQESKGVLEIAKSENKFTVRLKGLATNGKTTKVVIPIWSSKNGQNDLKWYTATKQSNGTYLITSDVSNHLNETGKYYAHCYITLNGKQEFLVGTSFSM